MEIPLVSSRKMICDAGDDRVCDEVDKKDNRHLE